MNDETRVVAVATDGSQPAGRAVRWAADLARAHDARLHVVQVVPPDHDGTDVTRGAFCRPGSPRPTVPRPSRWSSVTRSPS